MKSVLKTLLFLLIANYCYSQQDTKSDIQYIKIKDTVLIGVINKIVYEQLNNTDTSNLFKKGMGYIEVHLVKYDKKDTLREYYVSPQLFSIKQNSPDVLYPDYYSFVNNKLITVYLDVLGDFSVRQYSDKAKGVLRALIDQHLEKTKKVTFYDMDGKEMFTDNQFRMDHFNFAGGYDVYILKDKPPIIKKETQ